METDITLMTLSYVFVRLAVLASVGYLFYRIVSQGAKPAPVRVRADSAPTQDRLHRRGQRSG